MLNDEPTLPNIPRVAPGAPPPWPVPAARSDPRRPRQPASLVAGGCVGAAAAGICVVLFIGVVMFLSNAGLVNLGQMTGSQGPGRPVLDAAPSPTPGSPTPSTSWLQVHPSSVALGCGKHSQSQVVRLTNQGPQILQWQASLSVPPDQANVSLSSDAGQLDSGASTTLQVQLHYQDQSGSQQGVIRFVPGDPQAGPAVSVTYTVGCG